MNEILINDIRTSKDFTNLTFSKFQRSEVRKALIESLENNNIEPSLFWSAELICAGHYNDIWNIIIYFIGKFINTANPKLAIYTNIRFENFKNIIINGYRENELALRNNEKIRKIIAEIIIIICLSKKNHTINTINIKSDNEFDFINLSNKLKASEMNLAMLVFKENDPRDIYIPINEFVYSISEKVKDKLMACYWIEWLLKFELLCKKKKNRIYAERRQIANVDEKNQLDFIWIIWEAILLESNKLNQFYQKLIHSILDLFSIKFTNSIKRQRKFLLYYVVTILIDKPNQNIELINNKKIISDIKENLNLIYKEIKKNEISPKTDYLFEDTNTNKLEKTLDKLNLVNDLDLI